MAKKKEAAKLVAAKRDYKKELEVALDAIKEWNRAYDQAVKDKEDWFQIADKAHKEQEAMLQTVTELTENAINGLIDVHVTTDEITPLDVIYNVSMINRVMQAKFNPETEEE